MILRQHLKAVLFLMIIGATPAASSSIVLYSGWIDELGLASAAMSWNSDPPTMHLCYIEPKTTNLVAVDGEAQTTSNGFHATLRKIDGSDFASVELIKRRNGSLLGELNLRQTSNKISVDLDSFTYDQVPLATNYFFPEVRFFPRTATIGFRWKPKHFKLAMSEVKAVFPYYACYNSGDLIVDFKKTDPLAMPQIISRLRNSGFFDVVEVYPTVMAGGGLVELRIPKTKFTYNTPHEFISRVSEISDSIARDYFCKKVCTPESVYTGSSTYKVFNILARSKDLHLHRSNHWEKYILSMLFYEGSFMDNKAHAVVVQIQLTSGWIAPFRESAEPPEARYEPIPDAKLTAISNSIQPKIAKDLGGNYGAEDQSDR
jgi:hypothetical protein